MNIKNVSNWGATLLGAGTSVATALAVIDWDTFVWSTHWPKLIILALPAIGGATSSFNTKNPAA